MLQLKIKATELTGLVYRELLDVQRNAEKAAGGVRELVKRHFEARGGQRFWGEAAESVEVAGSSKGAVVGIYQRGVALRFFGGVVRPVRGKALALPTRENKTDLWPREFDEGELHYMAPPGMHPMLYLPGKTHKLTREGKLRKGASVSGDGKIMFVLVPQTEHKADPSVLPSPEEMTAAALKAMTTAN